MEKRSSIDLREKMVREQIEARGIKDRAVLSAMREVPREEFVPAAFQLMAYADEPLPIEENQTISQPYIVALMAEALELKPEDHVLEIGTGSGYAAAVLSRIVSHVYTIEYFPKLASLAEARFKKLGYTNISVRQGDGHLGWPEHAPYPAISVTAGGEVPPVLLDQLAIGGRLIMPVNRDIFGEELMRIRKQENHELTYESLGPVRFVPLLGGS